MDASGELPGTSRQWESCSLVVTSEPSASRPGEQLPQETSSLNSPDVDPAFPGHLFLDRQCFSSRAPKNHIPATRVICADGKTRCKPPYDRACTLQVVPNRLYPHCRSRDSLGLVREPPLYSDPFSSIHQHPTGASVRQMKILMLHGYTQNGPLFQAKTKVLEKYLKKLYPDLILSYPTGPLRLRPEDVPGYESSGKAPDDLEAYGWWRRSNTANPPEYAGIDICFDKIANLINAEGPFDGVMGFSQGAALAAMVTSLLERPSRQEAFKRAQESSSLAIPYPTSFGNLSQPPLKFLVSYCGFRAPGERYNGFYEDPTIQTPSCHVNGSLDTLVEESRWRTLMQACGGEGMTRLIIHPGGHFVPSGKQYVETVAEFIRTSLSPEVAQRGEKEEVRAEDMAMPF